MADRRGVLVPLVILAFIFLSPEPSRVPPGTYQDHPVIQDVIAEEKRSLSVVLNSTWEPDFGSADHALNLTGLDVEAGFAWSAFPGVRGRAQELLEYSLGSWGLDALSGQEEGTNTVPLYRNVTGYVQGRWTRSRLQENISVPQLNLSNYAPPGPFGQPGYPRPFDRNITGREGDVTMRFRHKEQQVGIISNPATSNITDIGVEVAFTDTHTYEDWEFLLRGVYFADIGQAILTTTSDKFAGIFMLPHLALSPHNFDLSKTLLNESITRVIERQANGKLESLNPWSSSIEATQDSPFATPDCDIIMYLQQLAPRSSSSYSTSLMSFLEHELRSPTGAFVPSAPDMHFAMLAFSPDCGFVLESNGPPATSPQESDHLVGPKMEVQYLHSRKHLLAFTFVLGFQLFLLMRQMREASTPSTRSRISFYTIATLALGDGFTTMTFLLISLFITGLWVNLIGTGFVAFISVSFFGMRFLMDIWAVQAPERARRAREELEEERRQREALNASLQRIRLQREANRGNNVASVNNDAPHETSGNVTTNRPGTQPASTDTLPMPVTSQRVPTDTGASPIFMPSDQEGLIDPGAEPQPSNDAIIEARSTSFASLYTRFYLLLLASLFISLNATSWPAPIRHFYFLFLAMMYLSFWVPQIHRNVQRNCRHALNWEFVIGQSVLRLMPFAYFYGYEHNILFAEVNYYSLALLAIWVWIQVAFLVSQEMIGPRWFIRKDWAPPAYDYHPVLREDEEGATMPIGFSQVSSAGSAPQSPIHERSNSQSQLPRGSIAKEVKERGKRVFDCAICMQDLEVPVIEAGAPSDAGLGGGLLARRTYMVTPCRHIFHSACLEGWMKYRLQCPICREALPPL